MDWAYLGLDYLKVIFSWPVVCALAFMIFIRTFKSSISLLLERANVKGAIGSASLEIKQQSDSAEPRELPKSVEDEGKHSRLEKDVLLQEYQKATSQAAYWEYRYLNLFLVEGSKIVLHIVCVSDPEQGIVEDALRKQLQAFIQPNNMDTILNVLQAHQLIARSGGRNSILRPTPKGIEYDTWRGALG